MSPDADNVSRLRIFYSDTFELPLPAGHRFPIDKYRLLREALQDGENRGEYEFQLADAATDEQLLRVHTANYLTKLKDGALSPVEQRRLGFPWSPQLVERSRRSMIGAKSTRREIRDERSDCLLLSVEDSNSTLLGSTRRGARGRTSPASRPRRNRFRTERAFTWRAGRTMPFRTTVKVFA